MFFFSLYFSARMCALHQTIRLLHMVNRSTSDSGGAGGLVVVDAPATITAVVVVSGAFRREEVERSALRIRDSAS